MRELYNQTIGFRDDLQELKMKIHQLSDNSDIYG
jgi:hypothetical protein